MGGVIALESVEIAAFRDIGDDGRIDLADALVRDGLFDTLQRGLGYLCRCANEEDRNGLRLRDAKRLIRAAEGRAS